MHRCAVVVIVGACGRGHFDAKSDAKIEVSVDGCRAEWEWRGGIAGWTLANPAGIDCCGCGPCDPCPNNTSLTTSNGIAVFDSGPLGTGTGHQQDGFYATYAGVSLTPGVAHDLTIDIVDLDGHISGSIGVEPYYPTWSLEVHDGATTIAKLSASWSSPQCLSCTPVPADLGLRTVTFIPTSATVDVVLWATLRDSQCNGEPYGLQVHTDLIRISFSGC